MLESDLTKRQASTSLLKGIDDSKDQSYVLYHMTQDQLAHTMFPLGEYTKDEIRKKAAETWTY